MRRKGRQTEHQTAIRKFLDRTKDSIKRLKALKLGLEKSSAQEVKQFFSEHSADVFYVVFGSFTALELTIRDKLSRGKGSIDVLVKELTELVLPQFQQILISLPEMVHQKWQFNSICLIIRKLLHPDNHMKLRQYGVQLLVLWVEALQENAGDPCMELFASVVPHFPPQKTPMGLPLAGPSSIASGGVSSGLGERYGVYSSPTAYRGGGGVASGGWGAAYTQSHLPRSASVILLGASGSPASREMVCPNILLPLVPHGVEQGGGVSVAEQLMVCLLESLTEQTRLLHWEESDRHLRGFAHLFFLFKLFYLACLYKDFRDDAALYTPPAPLPTAMSSSSQAPPSGLNSLLEESVEQTDNSTEEPTPADSALTVPGVTSKPSPVYQRKRGDPYRMSSVIKLEYDLSNPIYAKLKNLILTYVLRWFLPSKDPVESGVGVASLVPLWLPPTRDGTPNGVELMRQMWLTSRDNVGLLLEICRQGFTSLTQVKHHRMLLELYRHWHQVPEKPRFMLAPPTCGESTRSASVMEGEGKVRGGGVAPSVQCWEQLSDYEGFKNEHVEVGVAASLSMIIAHTQQVFVLKPGSNLSLQKEQCRKVIRLYQDIVMSWMLDKKSWEYLLSVLLHHTLNIFTCKDTSLANVLATTLLKTLLVSFLRVSVAIPDLNPDLWDTLLHVMHSVTHWKEAIVQWKAAMDSMTEVLAQVVYGLNLNDLPLNTLALGQRPRSVSMGKHNSASLQGVSTSRLSSFTDISEGPPMLLKKPGDERKSSRGLLTRSATHEEEGSSPILVPPVKRHSTPGTPPSSSPSSSSSRVPRASLLTDLALPSTITELPSPEHSSEQEGACPSPPRSPCLTSYEPLEEEDDETHRNPTFESAATSTPYLLRVEEQRPHSNSEPPEVVTPYLLHTEDCRPHSSSDPVKVMTPYQPLMEEDEGSVITNLNTTSPTLLDQPQSLLTTRSPTPKEEGQQPSKARKLPGSLFKQTNKKKVQQDSEALAKSKTLGSPMMEEKKKKRRWFHMRTGSGGFAQLTTTSSMDEGENSDRELEEVGVASDHNSPVLRRFVMKKSFSEGNIQRLSATFSDLDPRPLAVLDTEALPGRRVTSIAPPSSSSLSNPPSKDARGMASPPPAISSSASSSSHRPLRRSLTIDSPEPTSDETSSSDFLHPSGPLAASCSSGCGLGGWSPTLAAVVWLRMLKVLGNINEIKDPLGHAEAMAALNEIWNGLSNLQDNSGICMSNRGTPPLPEFMPPMELFLPWVAEACYLPAGYAQGKELAIQLLCKMTITHWHTPPPPDHLAHFYHLMRTSLQPHSGVCAVAVKYGYQLFSHGLASSSVLLQDCVTACAGLLSSPNSMAPHIEPLYMLSSMLHLPNLYPHPSASGLEGVEEEEEELKERIVEILLTSAMKETGRISRCIALYSVGTLVFSHLLSNTTCPRLLQGLDILLASLQFTDRGVAMTAIDMMSLLSEVGADMQIRFPSMPFKIMQAICYAIAVFLMGDLEVSWVGKVVVTLLLLLRDWLMVLPLYSQDPLPPSASDTIRILFQVLQAAAGSSQPSSSPAKGQVPAQQFAVPSPVTVELEQLVTSTSKSSQATGSPFRPHSASKSEPGRDVILSTDRVKKSLSKNQADDGRIQTVAKSVLTHLLNLCGHFPFGCGAAQLSSSIKEHHDCPSLSHLEDISPEVFDSPRMQFFALDNTAVVTLVEIPTQLDGVPGQVCAGPYQTRLIVRDVTGKYTWDSTLLYGPDVATATIDDTCSLLSAESLDSLSESVGASSEGTGVSDSGAHPPRGDLSVHPPSWRTHANTDRDVLQDLLEHVQLTSPECIPESSEPSSTSSSRAFQSLPAHTQDTNQTVEGTLLHLLHQQQVTEHNYTHGVLSQPGMRCEKVVAPKHFPHTTAFHHCCVFLSHLGLLSWDKRNHLNLLDKTNQLILELKNLDLLAAQSRATYKVAVLYVAPGQEDRDSILSNTGGSHRYEELVSGLGWEVDMGTHAGYLGGMSKEFASWSMPYYATSSEEVLFHVATRMTCKLVQKVRHLGNDEVHIIWSEHWRDYRRSIFRTHFADILIVLYPLPSGLVRIHIDKKPNVPQFGPLFDGALVDRLTLAPLVRATAINGLRAQRNPFIGYRGRYEERLKYIQTITSNQLYSTYENFCENVMHPLEMSISQSVPLASNTASTGSPQKRTLDQASSSLTNLLRSYALSSSYSQLSSAQGGHHMSMETALECPGTPPQRQRASTNDDRMTQSSNETDQFLQSFLTRNASVPGSLNVPSSLPLPTSSRGLVFHGDTSPL